MNNDDDHDDDGDGDNDSWGSVRFYVSLPPQAIMGAMSSNGQWSSFSIGRRSIHVKKYIADE